MSTRPLSILLLLAACALRPYDFGATATDTGDDPSTTTAPDPTTGTSPPTTAPPDPGTSTTTTTTTDATTAADNTTQTFIIDKDGGTGTKECDPWLDDCPEGQKCMPYSGDGDNTWESLKCVPIVPDPDGLYEPCTVVGSGVSGEDSCDFNMMCWSVDPDTGFGTCIGNCTGTPDNPGCEDPSASCLISGEVLTLCLPGCDPILQDCPNMDLCVPNPQNPDSFICVIDASGEEGQVFDTCEYANACDPGLICADPALAVECDPQAAGCCLPYCDLSQPNTCPGKEQQCLPWHEDGQAPPGLENVGTCGMPI